MALLVLALNVASDSVVAVEHNLYKNAKVFIHDQFNFAFTLMVRRTRVLRKVGGGKKKEYQLHKWKFFPLYVLISDSSHVTWWASERAYIKHIRNVTFFSLSLYLQSCLCLMIS